MKTGRLFVMGFVLLVTSTGEAQDSLFRDVTEPSKLYFVHDPGQKGLYLLPEITGSGGGFLDFDNDGDLDIYLIQSGPLPDNDKPNQLFRQEEDGSFADVTDTTGLGDTGYGMGLAVGDIDNDGWVDVFVSNYGPDALYRNERGRFTDVTQRAGLSTGDAVAGRRGNQWSASAVFCDYDADGFLDLYVTRYVNHDENKRCTQGNGAPDYCSPQVFPGSADVLFHNDGDGTFSDVSASAGIRTASAPGLGVVCADFNGDGLMDFYVANDGEANQLWENRGRGKFEDQAFLVGVALNNMGQPEAGMGLTAGDIDSDGDLDLFMTHLVNETNTLYVNQGALGFEDRSAASGLGASSLALTGFGTGFLDFDNDGDLDIAVVNGRVQRNAFGTDNAIESGFQPYAEPNLLLRNRGPDRFEDASAEAGSFASTLSVSRGLALGDVDNDGDVDMLVTNTAGAARLYRNEASQGHWLTVRTHDPALGRDLHGTLVTVIAQDRRLVRVADPGFGFLSSHDPRAHFGLGPVSLIDAIRVRWPDGSEELFPGGPADQHRIAERGRGRTVE